MLFQLDCGAEVEAINGSGFSAQAIASIRGNQDLANFIAGYRGKFLLFMAYVDTYSEDAAQGCGNAPLRQPISLFLIGYRDYGRTNSEFRPAPPLLHVLALPWVLVTFTRISSYARGSAVGEVDVSPMRSDSGFLVRVTPKLTMPSIPSWLMN